MSKDKKPARKGSAAKKARASPYSTVSPNYENNKNVSPPSSPSPNTSANASAIVPTSDDETCESFNKYSISQYHSLLCFSKTKTDGITQLYNQTMARFGPEYVHFVKPNDGENCGTSLKFENKHWYFFEDVTLFDDGQIDSIRDALTEDKCIIYAWGRVNSDNDEILTNWIDEKDEVYKTWSDLSESLTWRKTVVISNLCGSFKIGKMDNNIEIVPTIDSDNF